jgi:hypothetical protein
METAKNPRGSWQRFWSEFDSPTWERKFITQTGNERNDSHTRSAYRTGQYVPSKNTGLCLSMPMSTRFIHERVVSTSHVHHGGIYRSLCSLLQLCT